MSPKVDLILWRKFFSFTSVTQNELVDKVWSGANLGGQTHSAYPKIRNQRSISIWKIMVKKYLKNNGQNIFEK